MVLRAVAVGLVLLAMAGCARSAPVTVPTVVFVDGVSGEGVTTTSEAVEDGASWKPREEVEVEWHGSWWPAVVLEQRGNRWLVHYEGYGSDWDEVVGPDRIRERRAELQVEETDEVDEEVDP